MKNYTIILLIFILAVSCRTVKQDYRDVTSKSDLRTDVDYKSMYEGQLEVNSQLEQKIAVLTDENVKLNSEINTHEIEYDTDKPIDPATNNPPKKKERFQSNKQNIESTSNTTTSVMSNLNVDYSFYINQIDDLQMQLDAKTKEHEDYKSSIKSRMAVDVWWFWSVLGIVLGGLAVWKYKNWRKHF